MTDAYCLYARKSSVLGNPGEKKGLGGLDDAGDPGKSERIKSSIRLENTDAKKSGVWELEQKSPEM